MIFTGYTSCVKDFGNMSDKTKIKKLRSSKDKNRIRNIVILVVVLLLIIAGGAYSAIKAKNGGGDKLKPTQETEVIKTDSMRITVKATGNLEPWEKIDLRPEASGKVEQLLVEEGDIVVKGQTVALLDQTSQKNSLERASANVQHARAFLDETKKGYRNMDKVSYQDRITQAEMNLSDAQREFERVKKMYDKGFASQMEYDNAESRRNLAEQELKGLKNQLNILLVGSEKEAIQSATAQYNIALADLKEAERMLGDSVVKAPMSGVVLKRYVTEGSVILSGMSTFSQGEALISIGDVGIMKLIAQVDEGDVEKVKIGQKALIEVDAYPDEKFEGSVKQIAPQGLSAESVMTTFGVTIEIANADNRLKSGFTADLEIVVEELGSALLVPFRAVLEDEEKFWVFIVNADDKIEEREIKVGKTNYDYFEVLEGLTAGEKVITKGRPSKLKKKKGDKEGSSAFSVQFD
jgi:HlyD family secretion protein